MSSDSLDDLKKSVCDAVDALSDTLLHVSHEIHANPELAFKEYEASSLLVATLRDAGLEVEAGAYGLETAFASEFGAADGPVVDSASNRKQLFAIGIKTPCVVRVAVSGRCGASYRQRRGAGYDLRTIEGLDFCKI